MVHCVTSTVIEPERLFCAHDGRYGTRGRCLSDVEGCEFKDKGGNSLLERDITGNVRFVGGNLKATYDFAKKAANVAAENFSALARRNSYPAHP
jgi:hypothetical protein